MGTTSLDLKHRLENRLVIRVEPPPSLYLDVRDESDERFKKLFCTSFLILIYIITIISIIYFFVL